ncbi:MAG: zf-TFIIB domain-containing protein [Bdellovibrionota bacterium]
MSNAWDDMKRAKEDSYFAKKDQEALARLATKQEKPRLSPITGEPMEHVVLLGVVVDRCPTSGGVWLDKGELEHLIAAAQSPEDEVEKGKAVINFFKELFGGKKE